MKRNFDFVVLSAKFFATLNNEGQELAIKLYSLMKVEKSHLIAMCDYFKFVIARAKKTGKADLYWSFLSIIDYVNGAFNLLKEHIEEKDRNAALGVVLKFYKFILNEITDEAIDTVKNSNKVIISDELLFNIVNQANRVLHNEKFRETIDKSEEELNAILLNKETRQQQQSNKKQKQPTVEVNLGTNPQIKRRGRKPKNVKERELYHIAGGGGKTENFLENN